MAFSITGNSSGLRMDQLAGANTPGAVIQTKISQNTTTASKVFSAYNVFEDVPGQLRNTITPTRVGNYIVAHAHLMWGGWYNSSSVDVGTLFRLVKSFDGGTTWVPAGNYSQSVSVPEGGVATGVYKYNQGNNDSSYDSDELLITDRVTSTASTIYAVHWACSYAPTIRTIYWNRSTNTGNSYNPNQLCTIMANEVKV
jgi:hypothetical protein